MKTQTSTTTLYPLGIVRSRDVPVVADETAHGQVDVRWLLAEELACAAVNSSDVPPKPLEHIAALDAIHRRISVLPIRFATQTAGEEGIRRLLLEQRQELMQCLDCVDGASEIGLRISSSPCRLPENVFEKGATAGLSGSGVHAKTSSSADYLARRRAVYQREDQLTGQARLTIDRYVSGLDGLYRQWRNMASSPPGVVRLAFLVERERFGLFRDRLAVLRGAKQGERCEMLGPWPPYSFV